MTRRDQGKLKIKVTMLAFIMFFCFSALFLSSYNPPSNDDPIFVARFLYVVIPHENLDSTGVAVALLFELPTVIFFMMYTSILYLWYLACAVSPLPCPSLRVCL